jgi:N utilization substance protein B
MKGARRRARALALQALYEIDAVGHAAAVVPERMLEEQKLSIENTAFVHQLVEGVIQNRDEIDASIKKFAPAWPIQQTSLIDRNILRLAIFEILIDNRVPVKVAINEAVELAKKFGGENSARFVNGVLSSISALATR